MDRLVQDSGYHLGEEKRADDVDRVQKLKDARSEAAKEIEEYKAKKEAEYKKFESEVCHPRPIQSHHRAVYQRTGAHAC